MVEEAEAVVPVFDRGFLFGDGVFETMRAAGGRVFRLARHLERLERGTALAEIDLPGGAAAIEAAVAEVLHANDLRDARVRVTVTRGPGRPGDYAGLAGPATVVVTAQPFHGLDPMLHERGVEAAVAPGGAIPAGALDPAIKSLSRLSAVLARRVAARRGAFEAILTDARGMLTEGTVSNLFLVAGGLLETPAAAGGCLPGVTREAILALAREAGFEVREAPLPARALEGATEIFLTNTSWEVLPVARLDGRPVGDGRPGPASRTLLRLYRELVRRECADD
jgi:D-amino acid aminotransferase